LNLPPKVRDAIVPVNKRHDLASLLGSLQRHYPRGNPARRRVLIEYVMLEGVNDTLEDAERWVGWMSGSWWAEWMGSQPCAALPEPDPCPHSTHAPAPPLRPLRPALPPKRLVSLLEPIEAKVNLICFNAHPGAPFTRTPIEQVLAFRSVLIRAGRVCTIRDSRGDDQLAACGQLGDVSQAVKRPARRGGRGGGGAAAGGAEAKVATPAAS
jgi:23S rRNA (adenine2503-C2)-methyltransferase